MAEQRQRKASQQPAEEHSRQRQEGPRSRKTRQTEPLPTDPLQRLQALANSSPQTAQLRRLQELANNSPQAAQLRRLQELANTSPQVNELRQLQAMAQGAEQRAEAEPSTAKPEPAKAKPNLTGLPDHLKSNLEALSGLSMDAVRVHYNSTKPAQLNALAYAQGTDIHLGPGQEQHLPHEAWHVVQQAQGRVRPTMQMAGGVAVNDDAGLEREADVMGGRAVIQPKSIAPLSMPDPYLTAQLKTTVNNKNLAKKSITFGLHFKDHHLAENKEDAATRSMARLNGVRGQNNTVIKGNLDEIKNMIIDADAKLVGKPNSSTEVTISGEYWYAIGLKGPDHFKLKDCTLHKGSVKLKGYLQKNDGLKITGVAG